MVALDHGGSRRGWGDARASRLTLALRNRCAFRSLSVALAVAGSAFPAWADVWNENKSCIASIADLDGDGVGDLLVANRDTSRRECVWAVSGKTGKVLFRVDSAQAGDRFGNALAQIGDVDRDGVADFAVGALGAYHRRRSKGERGPDAASVKPGYVRLHSGKDGRVLHTINATAASGRFGFALGPAGDVDGDGVPDLAVGNPRPSSGGPGSVQLYSGNDGSLLRTVPAPSGDFSADWFGCAVALVGDLDGDGRPDLAVGAQDAAARETSDPEQPARTLSGAVFIVSGRDGSLLKTLWGESHVDTFGSSIACLPHSAGGSDGVLAVAATSHYVRVWSLADWEVRLTIKAQSFPAILDEFGTSLDFVRDARTGTPLAVVAGAAEDKVFFDVGYAVVHPLDGSKALTLVTGQKQGIDVCALGDVDGDGMEDCALVFLTDMKLRVVSGKDATTIHEAALLEPEDTER